MVNKIVTIFQSLFGREIDFRNRIFRIILALALVASIIGTCSVFLGTDYMVLLALIPLSVVSAVSLYVACKYNKIRVVTYLLAITVNMIFFPIIFIMSEGMYSGAPVWMVLGIVYVFLFFKGREFAFFFGLSVLSFGVTYWIGYRYPEILFPMQSKLSEYADSFLGLIAVGCCIGLIMRFHIWVYNQERMLVEEQKRQIEYLAKAKDGFFANMSHEIRTPINTIIGLNEMILREDISEEIAENALNIQNASKMLLTTINDILDMSKLESGKMELVPVQYETGALFSDLVNLIWLRAQEKGLEFKVDIASDIPSMLYGDEIRIKQIVVNMLTNAVKYTNSGSVTLSAEGERIGGNRIRLRISVTDTGIGIKKENLDMLFESFHRVDEKVNRHIEGTGLGLSITRQLLEMMEGRIYVNSVYHKGSTFVAELEQEIINYDPIGNMDFYIHKETKQRAKYRQSFTAPQARVLVVDDNEMNRLVARKLLRDTQIQVDTAESGRECLKKTKDNYYHVILMDHVMPEMDGQETLRAVRSQTYGYCTEVPVIAMTANVMTNASQIYQDMGFSDYLAKPVSGALLEAMLLKYLPKELINDTDEALTAEKYQRGIHPISAVRKRRVGITADCICDLPDEWLEQYRIKVMYFYIRTEEGSFADLREVTSDSILDYLKEGNRRAVSEAVSPEEYEVFFADALEESDQVLHLSPSAELSGGFASASQGSKSFSSVVVMDTGHISSGYGMMVYHAALMAEDGKSIQEICDAMRRMEHQIFTNFIVPNADALYWNGKVSGVMRAVCNALELHLILHISKKKLVLWGIETGSMRQAGLRYVRRVLKHRKQIDTKLLFLTYAGCSAQQINEVVQEVKKYVKFEKIVLQKASATISSNSGLGTFGVLYQRKDH